MPLRRASSAFRLGLIYILVTFESHSPFCFFYRVNVRLKKGPDPNLYSFSEIGLS